MKKIILYGLNDDRKNQIQSLFNDDITIKYIDKSYLEVKVGDIFDIDEIDVKDNIHDNSVFNNEFMLIQSFDRDRKSTRLNSSHTMISYAVFCLKKKK